MSSIYSGSTSLRTRYTKVPFGSLSAATSKATALQVLTLDIATRYIFMENKTDQEVDIYLLNPAAQGAGTSQANLLLWYQLGSGDALNNDQIPALGMEIDPGSKIFLACSSGTPTANWIKILAWG